MSHLDGRRAFERFRAVVNEQFSFLNDQYGFRDVEAELSIPEMWVSFRNATTQVSIQFEYGSEMWISIGQLGLYEGREVASPARLAALYLRRSTNEELQVDSLDYQEEILCGFAGHEQFEIDPANIFRETAPVMNDPG